jgi:hypothetical protein
MRSCVWGAALALLALGAPAAGQPAAKPAAGLVHLSGGVGKESREELARRAGEFNVKLVFTNRSGSYVANVSVTVRDASGRVLGRLDADGPWLLLKLPAGDYSVAARFAGATIEERFAAPARGQRVVHLRWARQD